MIWANCLFSFNMSFLLRKVEDVTTIRKSQSLTPVSIKDCTLRVPNETTTLFLLRVMIKTIFIHTHTHTHMHTHAHKHKHKYTYTRTLTPSLPLSSSHPALRRLNPKFMGIDRHEFRIHDHHEFRFDDHHDHHEFWFDDRHESKFMAIAWISIRRSPWNRNLWWSSIQCIDPLTNKSI